MSLGKNSANYSKTAKLIHWGFVILFVFGIAKQVDDINQLEDVMFFRFEIILFDSLTFSFKSLKDTSQPIKS